MTEKYTNTLMIPGGEDPLEKEMATHSSILVWEIPWTGYSQWGCKGSDMTEQLTLYYYY